MENQIEEIDVTASLSLAEAGELSNEQMLQLLDRAEYVKREAKALAERIEAAAIGWMKSNGKDIVLTRPDGSSVRFYVGVKKTTKCVNRGAALDAIIQLAGGDMEQAAGFLSSDAFKYGACRAALEENPVAKFDDLFVVEQSDELKEGSAKRLQKVDSRFLK